MELFLSLTYLSVDSASRVYIHSGRVGGYSSRNKNDQSAPQEDGSGALRERSLLCDHGSDVLARCPARQGAPANSGYICEDQYIYILRSIEINIYINNRSRGRCSEAETRLFTVLPARLTPKHFWSRKGFPYDFAEHNRGRKSTKNARVVPPRDLCLDPGSTFSIATFAS